VAPQVSPEGELPYHEWFIEFSRPVEDTLALAVSLDTTLQQKNSYYSDLRRGNILQPLKIRRLKPNTFVNYMRSQGKLGGQNKVPRLTNNRQIADSLGPYVLPD